MLYKWFLELPVIFGEIGVMITQPLFELGGIEINLLEIFGVSALITIITAKIIDLAIPV